MGGRNPSTWGIMCGLLRFTPVASSDGEWGQDSNPGTVLWVANIKVCEDGRQRTEWKQTISRSMSPKGFRKHLLYVPYPCLLGFVGKCTVRKKTTLSLAQGSCGGQMTPYTSFFPSFNSLFLTDIHWALTTRLVLFSRAGPKTQWGPGFEKLQFWWGCQTDAYVRSGKR